MDWLTNTSFPDELVEPKNQEGSLAFKLDSSEAVLEVIRVQTFEDYENGDDEKFLVSEYDKDKQTDNAEEKKKEKKKRSRRRKEGSSDSELESKKKRKEKKEKKRKKSHAKDVEMIGSLAGLNIERKSAFASLEEAREKPYFVDTRGDKDNLAFGSLYR